MRSRRAPPWSARQSARPHWPNLRDRQRRFRPSQRTKRRRFRSPPDIVAYGVRSHFVKSMRIQEDGRPPRNDGALHRFRVDAAYTDAVAGFCSARSRPRRLHYCATTKGAFVPDLDPDKHTLLIDGLVDRPRVFTMADLRRFPSVSEFHFVECIANSANATHTDVQQSHGNVQQRRVDRGPPLDPVQGVPDCRTRRNGSCPKAPRR